MALSTNEIRKIYLDFFQEKGHTLVESASLVPVDDPSLLFTNAGMVPFKDLLLGIETRKYTRAVSSQRCLRAGGKHNDLDNVGYTARHHTLFEMLGNFSFGDYFKEDAIFFAWELLTERYKISPEKLWITVHESDEESEEIWIKKVGVDPSRVSRLDDEENFWTMGETGPCGPCSEIYYDHGDELQGDPPRLGNEPGDRFVEIWNLVFTQFDRDKDGNLKPLPNPCVDTGMGLERMAAVLQNEPNNFDTDILKGLVSEVGRLTNHDNLKNPSLRVIADHLRASSFLIADGIIPSNEGRGYVLRRIIRRALRHAYKLEMRDPFLLNPENTISEEQKKNSKDDFSVKPIPGTDAFSGMGLMAFANTRVVRRSAALFDLNQKSYGADFTFKELGSYPSKAAARITSFVLMSAFLVIATPLRHIVRPFLLKPGEGPDQETRDKGWFKGLFIAKREDGVEQRFEIFGSGDPGYKSTSKMVCESALTLAFSEDLPFGEEFGGVLTSAVALGDPLISRLMKAGITFEEVTLSLIHI